MMPGSIPTLMPIGGGISERGEQVILNEFLRRAGGLEATIAIVTTASELPDSGEWYQHKLLELGLQKIPFMVDIHRREEACAIAYLDMIRQATGVFFTGGAQVRISAAIGGTPVHRALQEAHRSGAVIAGTSAGASILPAIMFAFGRGGPTPRQGIAQLVPGLGFIDHMIIDQHFRQRDRLGRLLYAVAINASILGLGIDENTAAVIEGDTLTVIGQGAVTIVDGAHMTATDVAEVSMRHPIAASGAVIHVLTSGCTFDLVQRRARLKGL